MNASLKIRLISGFILGPITLLAIIAGGIYFKMFVAIAFGLSFKEWVRMALKSKTALRDSIIGVLYLLIGFMALALQWTFFRARKKELLSGCAKQGLSGFIACLKSLVAYGSVT